MERNNPVVQHELFEDGGEPKRAKFLESPVPLNTVWSIFHSIFVKGDQTNFEIKPSIGVEASALYSDVKYTTVEEYLNRLV